MKEKQASSELRLALIQAIIERYKDQLERLERIKPEKRAKMMSGAQRTSRKSLFRTFAIVKGLKEEVGERSSLEDIQRTLPNGLERPYYTDASDVLLKLAKQGLFSRKVGRKARLRRKRGRTSPYEEVRNAENDGRPSYYSLNASLKQIQQLLSDRDFKVALVRQLVRSGLVTRQKKYMILTYFYMIRLHEQAIEKNLTPFGIESKWSAANEQNAKDIRLIKSLPESGLEKEAEKRAREHVLNSSVEGIVFSVLSAIATPSPEL